MGTIWGSIGFGDSTPIMENRKAPGKWKLGLYRILDSLPRFGFRP